MKDTGIARRVDQLGRIVLPMEIRKKLKIVEGTLLNLYMEDDGTIKLIKYSPLLNFKEYAEDILKEFDACTYLICDDNSIIFANKSFKNLVGGKVENAGLVDISDFKVIENEFYLNENFTSNFKYHYIFTVKKDGDVFGYIIFASENELSEEVLGECKFIRKYISSKL